MANELAKEYANIIHDQVVAMQAAMIEWKKGKGAEAALQWIQNTLMGPGHLPDLDGEYGDDAQAFFDKNQANPLPECHCGRPSNILWMGHGYCSNEHYIEAKAQLDKSAV